ncbi:hypothetical protein CsSME_00039306 [Camellia sinensis var. sinensis]
MSGPCCNQPVASGDENIVIPLASNLDDEWLESIMNEGESSSSSSNNTPMPKHKKIPKVLKMLPQMESNKECYEPEVVSISPYHHSQAKLQSFEKLKIRFTKEYVKSFKPETSATALYEQVADVAGEARNCYAEDLTESFDDRAFTQMLFLDGCFIIHYINICMNDKEEQDKMQMKMKNHDKAFVRRDLFLLENQLPFIVLNALMSMNSDFEGNKGLKLIEDFIKTTMARPPEDSLLEKVENSITKHVTDRKRKKLPEPQSQEPADHLLELLHRQLINPKAFGVVSENKGGGGSSCCYSYPLMKKFIDFVSRKKEGNSWYSYRSVQELKAAGIQFRPNKERNFFADARYEPQFIRAILRLPPMTIDDSTKALLLNLVAYEMCPDSSNDFGVTSYLWFMDTLIDQAEDVKELRKKGIILNFLGSDQHVAELFNEIAKNLVPNPNACEDVKKRIERHYKNKVRLWMTEWLYAHFSSPWTLLAFLGALLAIALSFVQAYYAVNPKK